MANEITLSFGISCFKTGAMSSAVSRAIQSLQRNWTGTTYIQDSMSVTTSELAIPLGNVTIPHFGFFLNLDSTNFIQIYDATGQSAHTFIELLAGDFAFVPMQTTLTAPFAKANVAPCAMEYLIFSQ